MPGAAGVCPGTGCGVCPGRQRPRREPVPVREQNLRQGDPGTGEQPQVTCPFGGGDRPVQRGGLAGLVLDPAEVRQVQPGCAREAESLGGRGRSRVVVRGVDEPALRRGDPAEGGLGASMYRHVRELQFTSKPEKCSP